MRKIVATVVFAAACGGGGNSNHNGIDAAINPDAGGPVHHDAPIGIDGPVDGPPDADYDATLATCLVSTNLGTVTPNVPSTFEDTDPPTDHEEYDDNLNNDTRPDQIAISLWPGFGVFTSQPVGPGTYIITGAETSIDSCGACVEIFADVDQNAGSDGHYMAQNGTLTITQISGHFAGTLTNSTLVRDDTSDGCSTHIDTLVFDAIVVPETITPHDAGVDAPTTDAGTDATMTTDAGTDATMTTDAGTDATMTTDGGSTPDAGVTLDAPADAPLVDGGASPDGPGHYTGAQPTKLHLKLRRRRR